MTVLVPVSVDDALAALQSKPGSTLLAGGTDYLVQVNFGHSRPADVIALRRVTQLRNWHRSGDTLTLGAGLTYTDFLDPELASMVPALAQAARTVGSPQIRNAGTLGGNVATASPAGDTLPVLIALDAEVVLQSAERGVRRVPLREFIVGVKRTVRESDELIVEVDVPVLAGGQEYLKVGTRNAMVISVAGVALVVDRVGQNVRCGLGSVGPVPLRCPQAEAYAATEIDWSAMSIHAGALGEFGRLAALAASPITDHRSTAEYRRHVVGVCAARALERVVSTHGGPDHD